jgi:hypothetical protein
MTHKNIASFVAGILVAGLGAFAWYYFAGHAPLTNFSVTPQNSTDNIFQVASSTGEPYLTVTAGGRVGIDTAIPQTAFDVRGMARVYTSELKPCTKEIEGAIAYDPYTEHFIGCNSFEWRRLDN